MTEAQSWGEFSGAFYDEFYDEKMDEVMVCIEHFRFVPCRGGHHQQPSGRYTDDRPCRLSSDPRMAKTVRGYQDFTGTDND